MKLSYLKLYHIISFPSPDLVNNVNGDTYVEYPLIHFL